MKYRIVLALGVSFLSACSGGAPSGQVVATVNGQEITREQLNTALRKLNLPASTTAKDAQNAVLEQLLAKQLVVQAAKQQGLDKSQSFLDAIQDASDSLLVSLYANKVAGDSGSPYEGDIAKFITDNPSRFSQRKILTVDQIRVLATDINPGWMKDVNTLDQLAAALKAHSIRFARGNATLDTATIDRSDFERLSRLRPGEPFAVQQGQVALYSSVTNAVAAPISNAEAHDAARDYLRNLAGRNALDNRLKILRKDAKVQYQNGFGASRTLSTGAPAAAAPDDAKP